MKGQSGMIIIRILYLALMRIESPSTVRYVIFNVIDPLRCLHVLSTTKLTPKLCTDLANLGGLLDVDER